MTAPARRFLYLLFCLAIVAAVNAAAWWWPNRPVAVGAAAAGQQAAAPGLIKSVSFAPFRRGQGPFTKVFPSPDQIAEDLAAVSSVAKGVRTYTAREGLQAVPELARRYNLDVIHSAWLGPKKDINDEEVEALIDQANRYPDTIKRVIVGNEVLLRRDLTADEVIGYIRKVKAAVKQPVSYADVWEFWLKNPRLLDEVDFVTVHFLPYWEDMPIGVAHSMPHIMDVYDIVAKALPGKPILIGEVGWPSQGRSRREAVPSLTEAAAFTTDFMRLAETRGLDYNLVEAFDQPWKAKLEGTVGGAWGVLDELRHPKFLPGGFGVSGAQAGQAGKVSDLPNWPIYAAFSTLFALILAVLNLQRLLALPFWRLLGGVALAQAGGAALAACVEHGLSHYFSTPRLLEFILLFVLQAMFALLLLAELLDRLAGKPAPQAALAGVKVRLGEIRSYLPLYLPLGNHTVSAEKLGRWNAQRRARLAEWLFIGFALFALYQTVMLAAAGRYRDFPVDYALLPVAGFLLLRILTYVAGQKNGALFALASGFTQPLPGANAAHLRWDAALAYLLIAASVVMLVVERVSNREAVGWALIAVAYAIPFLANLHLARSSAKP